MEKPQISYQIEPGSVMVVDIMKQSGI